MSTTFATLCSESTLYAAWNHVKTKGASGGIDGVGLEAFHEARRKEIPKLAKELTDGTWRPQPYMEIAVPKAKHPDVMRRQGMTAMRDKVVQQSVENSGSIEDSIAKNQKETFVIISGWMTEGLLGLDNPSFFARTIF